MYKAQVVVTHLITRDSMDRREGLRGKEESWVKSEKRDDRDIKERVRGKKKAYQAARKKIRVKRTANKGDKGGERPSAPYKGRGLTGVGNWFHNPKVPGPWDQSVEGEKDPPMVAKFSNAVGSYLRLLPQSYCGS